MKKLNLFQRLLKPFRKDTQEENIHKLLKAYRDRLIQSDMEAVHALELSHYNEKMEEFYVDGIARLEERLKQPPRF